MENDLFNMSVGNNDGHSSFGERINIGIVNSYDSAGSCSIENSILCNFLFGNIVF
jgi:hypothetical protein